MASIKIPITNTTAHSINFVKDRDGGTLEFDVDSSKVLVSAKDLYAWLKEHYESYNRIDSRQYVCASSLY